MSFLFQKLGIFWSKLGIENTNLLRYNVSKEKLCYIFLHKEILKMKENKLVDLIMSLTEEEIEKLISELPKLTELLNKPAQPFLQVPTEQNQ